MSDPVSADPDRVVPPPRTSRSAFQRIKDTMLNDSGVTEESDEEKSEVEQSSSSIKLPAYLGGAKAENWLEVVLCKLTPTQEAAYELVKDGTLKPSEFGKKERARDIQLYGSLLVALMDVKAFPEHESQSIFNRLKANRATIGRSGLAATVDDSTA